MALLMRERLADMSLFAQVVESKTFSAAAQELGLSKSLVSRKISALEESLSVKLLNRTTRRLTLIGVGALFHEHCRRVVQEAAYADRRLTQSQSALSGVVRVTCVQAFALRYLMPALGAFQTKYPEIRINLSCSNRTVDLGETGFDVGVRMALAPDPKLVLRKLAVNRKVLCASPAYLSRNNEPRVLDDVAMHDGILFPPLAPKGVWTFEDGGAVRAVPIKSRFETDDMDAAHAAVLSGLGLGSCRSTSPPPICGLDGSSGCCPTHGCSPTSTSIWCGYRTGRYLCECARSLRSSRAGSSRCRPGRLDAWMARRLLTIALAMRRSHNVGKARGRASGSRGPGSGTASRHRPSTSLSASPLGATVTTWAARRRAPELMAHLPRVDMRTRRLSRKASHPARGRRSDDAPEMLMQAALIIEANERSDLPQRGACLEELLRPHDPQLGEPRVRRYPDLCAERTAEAKLVDPGMRRELVERDRLCDALAKKRNRATHRPGVGGWAIETPERRERLGDRHIAREPSGSVDRRVEQAM